MANNGGHLVFRHGTAFTQGVYRADYDPAGKGAIVLSELVTLDAGFVGLPGFEPPLGYSINRFGAVLMVLQRFDFTQGIYLSRPGRALSLIAAEGDSVPGGGNLTSNLGAPSINAENRTAFFGGFGSHTAVFENNNPVVGTNTEVPNHPGTFFEGFVNVVLADDRTIVFVGGYILNGLSYRGIYKKSDSGLSIIFDQFDGIVVNGQRVSLIGGDSFFGGSILPLFIASRFTTTTNGVTRVAFQQALPRELAQSGIFIAELR